MAEIRPFRGICPRSDLTERIAALPYDVYSRQEAKAEVLREPLSFLRIDRAETQFDDSVDAYAPQVYQKAHDLLWEMIADGSYVQDESAYYYVYELTADGHSQTGLVAVSSVDDYLNDVILKHENTKADKETDRIRHVDACDVQTGPIFLAYRRNETVHICIEESKETKPFFDFTAPDGVRHRGWKITSPERIHMITETFAKEIPKTYIADGHHRAASAVRVAQMRREAAAKRKEDGKKQEYDYFLSVLFEQEELRIMAYDRVIEDLSGLTPQELLVHVSEKCEIRENTVPDHICEDGICHMVMANKPFHPKEKGQVGMYLDKKWYCLRFKETAVGDPPADSLDVAVLQREILEPFLGIDDPKKSERITYVGGRSDEELEKRVDQTGGVVFVMYPTSMEELFAVADEHLLMPPKSTRFEPKLCSGLFLHAL